MDLSHLHESLDEFEDFVEKYTSQMNDILAGKVPPELEELERKEAEAAAKKVVLKDTVQPVKKAMPAGSALKKQTSEDVIKKVPKAAEPVIESKPVEETAPVAPKAPASSKDVAIMQKPKNYLDYSRFDKIKDDEDEDVEMVYKDKEDATPKKEAKPEPEPKKEIKRTKITPLTNSDILRILSEEHRTAGNDAFKKRDFNSAVERYTLAIDTCLKPTKEMISEFKARTSKDPDPFAFLDKYGPGPESIVPDACLYSNRGIAKKNLGMWEEALLDFELCAETLKRNDSLENEKKFEAFLKAMCWMIKIQRKLDLLEAAEESLSVLLQELESREEDSEDDFKRIVTLEEAHRAFEIVQKELVDAHADAKLENRIMRSGKFEFTRLQKAIETIADIITRDRAKLEKTADSKEITPLEQMSEVLVNYLNDEESATKFRFARGFDVLLHERNLVPATLPFLLPIIHAAVHEGADARTVSSINTRKVTANIYRILDAYFQLKESGKGQRTLDVILWKLLALCSYDCYFLDYITGFSLVISVESPSIWNRLINDLIAMAPKFRQDHLVNVIAPYGLKFIINVLKHKRSGPNSLFNLWNIQYSDLLDAALAFISSTLSIAKFTLGTTELTFGGFACKVVETIFRSRSFAKPLPQTNISVEMVSRVLKVIENLQRGKGKLESDYQEQRIDDLVSMLYQVVQIAVLDTKKEDLPAEVVHRILSNIFHGFRNLAMADIDYDCPPDHMAALLKCSSALLRDHSDLLSAYMNDMWHETDMDRVLKMFIYRFLQSPERDEEVAMCFYSVRLLLSWLQSAQENAERWERREGIELICRVYFVTKVMRRQSSASVWVTMTANLALCMKHLALYPEFAEILFEFGALDTLVETLRSEKEKAIQVNLSTAISTITTNHEPARERLRELQGFELLYHLGPGIVG
ncbi:hypothetical protein HDU97_005845 [Phlyctochytrium planicorne]|nr:hypothetical protein HDU97_005845 [Phlyctochytrium planicorne]